jgi:diguanylate cyclase (GGDEF)-like protein/PAS domain S-box-containing protein
MGPDEQAQLFGSIAMSAADAVVASDLEGLIVWVNPAAADLFGWPREQLIGRPFTALLQEETRASVPAVRDRSLRGEHTAPFLAVGQRRSGETFEVSVTPGVRRDGQGRPRGTHLILREVTPEVEAQQALRDSEARYRAIAETAQEGILAVSPEGEILFANERLAEILSLPMEKVYALGGEGLFAPAKAAHAARRLAGRSREAGPEQSDLHYKRPDGSDRVLHVSASALTSADGSVLGSLAMVYDVTEQRAAEETLRRQALHDALTGLPNRILFVDRLNTAAARQARAEGGAVAVLFLDLDNFKEVNDVHGHEAGDRVLAAVAGRVEAGVRGTDTVARIGGDEFAVICEGADAQTATMVASRIQRALREPVVVDGKTFSMRMSIGIALSPPHRTEDLLRFADIAMYQAKAASRGSVVVFDEPGAEPDRR